MNFKETGFRGLYKQFSVYELNDNVKQAIGNLSGLEEANAVLVYGFYNREEGLMLEVLAAANIKKENVTFEMPLSDERISLKAKLLEKEDFSHIDDKDNFLAKRYADKLSVIKAFDADEKLEATRQLGFLDECRDPFSFDDIKVTLRLDGKKPEECYVRIDEQVEGHFVGTLITEPLQSFGLKEGDKVEFFAGKDAKGKIICLADIDPDGVITADDLEDGSMLEAAVTKFHESKSEADLISLLEIIRDSYVWVPGRMSNQNSERVEKLTADVFKNGDEFFLPIFSSEAAMKKYAGKCTKIPMYAVKAIELAKKSDKTMAGIVLNPFTEPFVIDMKLCDVIEKMKARVEE